MNCGWYNVVVIHELSKCHKSQPGASDDACVLLPSSNLVRKHGLMAQNEAEGPNFFLNIDSAPQILTKKWDNVG